jgi:hypothetical protein
MRCYIHCYTQASAMTLSFNIVSFTSHLALLFNDGRTEPI